MTKEGGFPPESEQTQTETKQEVRQLLTDRSYSWKTSEQRCSQQEEVVVGDSLYKLRHRAQTIADAVSALSNFQILL